MLNIHVVASADLRTALPTHSLTFPAYLLLTQCLLPLLSSSNVRVVARAAGAIHNLSSDAESIRIIRKYCGIPRLVLVRGAEV